MSTTWNLTLTPHGRLRFEEGAEGFALDARHSEALAAAFGRGSGHGILRLGAGEVGTALPPVLAYWREVGARYVSAVCALPDAAEAGSALRVPEASGEVLAALALAAPPMPGAERLTAAVLLELWRETDAAFREDLEVAGVSAQALLARLDPAWNVVGRVHFHLAENRGDPEAPFAFMASYTTRLSAHGEAQHLPLYQALRDYAGAANRERLLSLLVPVQRAAEACGWLREMVASKEVFHPLRWTAGEATRLLRDVPALEAAGLVERLPATWRSGRPPRPKVRATVGGATPSRVGVGALLEFQLSVALGDEALTPAEVAELLQNADGLALIRGQWVDVDPERLRRTLERFEAAERLAEESGLGFAEAMRLLAGAGLQADGDDAEEAADWSEVVAGPWLAEALAGLRTPEGLAAVDPGEGLRGTLRPYQEVGVRWLYLLTRLGLGGCLADDMGLGKTIQVLALLLVRKSREEPGGRPSLLVAPASLLANWVGEAARFAPGLRCLIAHPSALNPSELKHLPPERLGGVDLVVTTYGALRRLSWLSATQWDLVVLDEAQAIKNPGAQQTRAAKRLKGRARLALTGTPVENRLGDLWSLFDFINPGLLGSARAFGALCKRLAQRAHGGYGPLRELVRPYILRRMKTDKAVIADLPDKTEVTAWCLLARRQAALYGQAVDELGLELEQAAGIRRKGVVLAYLMRFKQICNHPSQWLGDGSWAEADSGKLGRLREIAEVVAARQDKMLLFTQFRQTTGPLAAFLGGIFGREGLVLHGGTPVSERAELVRRFQEDEDVPFFVLSLKAGGSGLNLTAASHVVHFDRWWNPAVENQATDRAFRIGQKANVLVHKLVCRGTVEEKIDALIEAKRALSQEVLEGGGEALLTELSDAELMRLVALDVGAVMEEV